CTCELGGKCAHYGYNCPPKVPIIPDPKPFNNQTIDELLQTLPCFDLTCYSGDGNSFTYDFTSNLVHDSPNVFNPPPQLPLYSCEFYGNDASYGDYCTPQIPICYDDDEDCTIAITPILSIEEPNNSLSMMDEHLDTILEIESDEFIKSCVENLVLIQSEFEGIPGNMCDVPFHDNSLPLDVSKDQFKDFSDFNDDSTSIDDDSFSIDNIKIDDDILLTIKDNILHEKLLNINLLIANIKETNTFDNSLPEFQTFYFDLEEISSGSTTTRSDISLPDYEAFYDDHIKEISSGSTTTRSDISLPDYEAFYDDHIKEISSGSTTTHFNSSLYDSFIFDLSINSFPPFDRSDFL
nr:hypothetical protein [Tanacetum cinerariifolium]